MPSVGFIKGWLVAQPQVILCPKVLHPWVRGKRPHISVVEGVEETHITSKKASAHHVVTGLLQE